MAKTVIPAEAADKMDYTKILKDAIAEAQKSGLTESQIKTLNKITPAETGLMVSALQIAAQDGLEPEELKQTLIDMHDLVVRAADPDDFKKMMANPADEHYKLTPPVIAALKLLTPEQQATLSADLHSQEQSIGHKILHSRFFKAMMKLGEEMLPILEMIAQQALKLALFEFNTNVAPTLVPGWGNVATKLVNDMGDLTIKKIDEMKVGDEVPEDLALSGDNTPTDMV